MRLSRTTSFGALILVLTALGTGTAFAIRNGTPTNDLKKTVMMFLWPYTNANQQPNRMIGTVTNVRFPRCMLTAAHVILEPAADLPFIGPDLNASWILQGQKPMVDSGSTTNPTKWAAIQEGEPFPSYQPHYFYADMAVLWLKNEDTPEGDTKTRMKEADYEFIQYDTNMGVGLANPTPPNLNTGALATGHQNVKMMGYGALSGTTTNIFGMAEKRKGIAHARYLVRGTQPMSTSGSAYVLTPNTPGDQLVCPGDSGGPLFKENDTTKTYGVAIGVGGGNRTCTAATYAVYTAIEDRTFGSLNPKEWLDLKTTQMCGRKLTLFVPEGGYVTGVLENEEFTYEDDLTVNGEVDCSNAPLCIGCSPHPDCGEVVHYDESITLTAHANAGYHFDHWQDGGYCPCDGSTSSTCVIDYDELGHYAAGVSIDTSECEAIFEADTGGGGGLGNP